MKQSKFIILIFVILFSSVINFYTNNFISTDIVNSILSGIHDNNMIATFPGLMVSFSLVLLIIYILRTSLYPQYTKAITKTYSIILLVFSSIGFITSVLTGAIVYHSFTKPYPFIGYPIIGIIINLCIIFFSIYVRFFYIKHLKDDEEIKKISFSYVMYTIGITLGIYYSLNRLGAFILSPSYIHVPTLYMTFVFYLSLLLPISLCIYLYLKKSNLLSAKNKLIFILIITSLNLILGLSTIFIGANSTLFVSAISPALGIERIITKPIITIGQFVILLILTSFNISFDIKYLFKNQDEELD